MSTPEQAPDQDPYGYHRPDPYGNGPYQPNQAYPPPPPAIPYSQQPYQGPYVPYPPPYAQPYVPKSPSSGPATVAFVFGLMSILFWWLVVPPLIALVMGIWGMKEAKAGKRGAGFAAVGLIFGGLGTLVWVFYLLFEVLGLGK